jgi:hypothetical protein
MKGEEKILKNIGKTIKDSSRPHQKAIDYIARRLRKTHKYAKIFQNLDYANQQDNEAGEFDILALRGFYNGDKRYALIFEVKSSKREECREKAQNQLEKEVREVKAFYGEDVRCFKFHIYTSNNMLRKTNKGKRKYPYISKWIK